MKITKVSAGHYRAENGFTIKKNGNKGWYLYNKDGLRFDYRWTFKEAKERLEELEPLAEWI